MKKHISCIFLVILCLLFSNKSFADGTLFIEDMNKEEFDDYLSKSFSKLTSDKEQYRNLAFVFFARNLIADNKSRSDIKIIEKHFNWKCILQNDGSCSRLIDNSSILNEGKYVWHTLIDINKFDYENTTKAMIFKSYEVLNCNNRTGAYKKLEQLDYYLKPINGRSEIIDDGKLKYEPIDSGSYFDRYYKYVCDFKSKLEEKSDIKNTNISYGTAWPVSREYVVTNYHVVSGKKNIYLLTGSGDKIPVNVYTEDKINDLAILKVGASSKLPAALPIALSVPKTGTKVFTIGYPHPDLMGAKPKLSEGIISSNTGYMDDPRTMQISTPIQAGNSGGPLLNMRGEVIGIVTSKLSAIKMFNWTGDLPQNVNYAIKIPYLSALLEPVKPNSKSKKMTPHKSPSLEELSYRINASILMIIAE